jgi:nucleoside-diphosphate-sugar epimerase
VRDIAKAFVHAVDHRITMKGNIYNVGLSEANVSKWELCEHIQKFIPTFTFIESPIGEDPDKRNYIVSNEKIEKTGFKTDVTLDAGIQELIKGFRMIRNTKYGNV